jgi:uncharacterized protein (UPF0548 family)
MTWTQNAVAGAAIWGVGVLLGLDASWSGMGSRLILIGAAVVAPLALALVDPGARRGRFAVARWMHIPAVVLLTASFLLAPGSAAAALSVPWLAFTFLAALLGALRFLERGGGPASEIAIDTGMVLLAVGGVWTMASRSGGGMFGFEEPWVMLTAAHFHFAGLALPVVTGTATRLVPGRLGSAACVGVAAGVPFVAAGITAGAAGYRTLEWLAALWLVAASLAASWTMFRAARRLSGMASFLLGFAAFSLAAGMTLAAVYATGEWLGRPLVSVPGMLRGHAPINAIGFALTALIALRISPRPAAPAGMEILLPALWDEPTAGNWDPRPFGDEVRDTDGCFAADSHEVELPQEPAGAPLEKGPFLAAAHPAMCYRTFPPKVLRSLRRNPDVPVTVGETIPAQYRLLPGIHMVFAARVVELFDRSNDVEHRTGFRYRTLAGHPECGEETFYVRKELATGRIFAGLFARSRPGNALVRFFFPLARRMQLAAGRAGAANLRREAGRAMEGDNGKR